MTVSTVAERLTADDYIAREDPRRTELIDGVVVVNEPTVLHQRVVGLIYATLLAWTQSGPDRGTVSLPLDIRLDDATVLAPDVLWFAQPIDLSAPRAPRMPDLAVEVRSPATWVYDVGPKRELYERHGLRELWLADTASRTLLVYRRQRRGGRLRHPGRTRSRRAAGVTPAAQLRRRRRRADAGAQLTTSFVTSRTPEGPPSGLSGPQGASRDASAAVTRTSLPEAMSPEHAERHHT